MIRLLLISFFSLGILFSVNSYAGCDCGQAHGTENHCRCMMNAEFGPAHERGGYCYETAKNQGC